MKTHIINCLLIELLIISFSNAMEEYSSHSELKEYISSLKKTAHVISPDHKRVATISFQNSEAKIISIAEPQDPIKLGKVEGVSFSPDGQYVAYTQLPRYNKPGKIFKIAKSATGECIHQSSSQTKDYRPLFKNAPHILFGISPEYKTSSPIIITFDDKALGIKKLNTSNIIFFGAQLESNQLVIFNLAQGSIDLIDKDGKLSKRIENMQYPLVGDRNSCISGDGNHVAWEHKDGVDCVTNIDKNIQMIRIPNIRSVNLAFSHDANYLAITENDRITLLNTRSARFDYNFNAGAFDVIEKGLIFSKVSWNAESFLIRFTNGLLLKKDNEEMNDLLSGKSENNGKQIKGPE